MTIIEVMEIMRHSNVSPSSARENTFIHQLYYTSIAYPSNEGYFSRKEKFEV